MHCAIYDGHIEANGYGKRGHVWVHREALAAKLGRPIAPGMDACHTCDTRACINPDHLYEGTRRQNMADAVNGVRQAALARRFGVHSATVSRIVRGIWRGEVPA